MKKRNLNIEFIRVLSCIFVILIHVSNHYRRHMGDISFSSYSFAMIVNVITRVAVPFFFMITGALLLRREPDSSFKRVISAMKTLAFWTVIYGLWECFFKGNDVNIIKVFYQPVTKHFWYMYVLIGIYIALPYIQILFKHLDEKLEKRFIFIWLIVLFVSYVSSFFKLSFSYEIPFIGSTTYYFGFFILGSYIYQHQNDIESKKSLWLGLLCFIILTIWAFHTKSIEKVLHYKNFFIVIGSACFFHYLLGIKKIPMKENILTVISQHSLGIYYIHIIFLDIFKSINFLPLHSIIGIPLLTIVILMMSMGSMMVISKLN